MVDVQPHLTRIQEMSDQLKSLGQTGLVDDLHQLMDQYSDLKESAKNAKNKLEQAVSLREVYYAHKGELETCLKQCEEQVEAVNVIGVTVPTKLDRYKVNSYSLSTSHGAL